MAMKWLRKHNKKIIVVGGAFLMVAFLMPRQDGCRGRKTGKPVPIAQAYGKNITDKEESWALTQLHLLSLMGLQMPVSNPMDYLLLVREARQMVLI